MSYETGSVTVVGGISRARKFPYACIIKHCVIRMLVMSGIGRAARRGWPNAGRRENMKCLVYVGPAAPPATAPPGVHSGTYDEIRLRSLIQQQAENVIGGALQKLPSGSKLPPGSWRGEGENEREAIERLEPKLSVERRD